MGAKKREGFGFLAESAWGAVGAVSSKKQGKNPRRATKSAAGHPSGFGPGPATEGGGGMGRGVYVSPDVLSDRGGGEGSLPTTPRERGGDGRTNHKGWYASVKTHRAPRGKARKMVTRPVSRVGGVRGTSCPFKDWA